MTWSDDLAGQLEFYWQFHLWPRLQGLTDAEYLWQPVGGMWSVRPDAAGVVRPDGALAEPPTPPVTTIAWRLDHLTRGVMGTRGRSLFGGSPLGETEAVDMYDPRHWPEPIPLDAAMALQRLEQSYTQWSTGVRGLDDAAMQRPLGPRGGQYADDSYGQLVLHINREVMAHGAEICLLRDLHRAGANDRDPLIAAVLAGDAGRVAELAIAGSVPGWPPRQRPAATGRSSVPWSRAAPRPRVRCTLLPPPVRTSWRSGWSSVVPRRTLKTTCTT